MRPFAPWRGGALALLMLGAAACGSYPSARPGLHVSSADFRQRVRTLCLVPVQTQVALPEQDAKLAAFEGQLAHRLGQGGFTVVPSEQSRAVTQRVLAAAGGYYDPYSGERDQARYDAVRPQVASALRGELGCDATVLPTIALVSVPFHGGEAQWDGLRYPYGSYDVSGWTAGLSLWVSIRDLDGQELFFSTGAIQALFSIKSGFFSEGFEAVSDTQVLTDQAKNLQAINSCLGPVLERPPAPVPAS